MKHDEFDKFLDKLKQQRDELNLKMHLAKAEAHDEWGIAEQKWERLKGKSGLLANEAGESAKEIGEAAKLVAEEIKHRYDRIWKILTK